MPPRKHLLIAEEALRDLGTGHWYEHVKTIATSCRAGGIEVTIAARQRTIDQVLRDLWGAP